MFATFTCKLYDVCVGLSYSALAILYMYLMDCVIETLHLPNQPMYHKERFLTVVSLIAS